MGFKNLPLTLSVCVSDNAVDGIEVGLQNGRGRSVDPVAAAYLTNDAQFLKRSFAGEFVDEIISFLITEHGVS